MCDPTLGTLGYITTIYTIKTQLKCIYKYYALRMLGRFTTCLLQIGTSCLLNAKKIGNFRFFNFFFFQILYHHDEAIIR